MASYISPEGILMQVATPKFAIFSQMKLYGQHFILIIAKHLYELQHGKKK